MKQRSSLPPIVWVLVITSLLFAGWWVFFANNNTPPDVKLPDLSAGQQIKKEEVTLYFSKAKGPENIIEPVVRKVPADKITKPSAEWLKFAVEQLLIGPNKQESIHGYFSEIPKGARLLGVSTTSKNIIIDLSTQFTSGGGANSMSQRLKELRGTVKSLSPVKPVIITIEGKPLELLGGEGLEVTEPITEGGEGDLL